MFKNKWCNIVGGWCVKYFRKYGEAPNQQIEGIFEQWSAKADKASVSLVERFLDSLSSEWETLGETINPKYSIDTAADLFNKVAAEKLKEEIADDLEGGKTQEALGKINSFKPIELGESESVNVLFDKTAIREAFEEEHRAIITYPGCLGHFYGDTLSPDSFVAFCGPDKVGKSFVLLDLAWNALLQRRRVAHFVVGDMSKRQVLRRYAARAARRPLRKTEEAVRFPVSIIKEEGELYATATFKERTFKKDMSWGTAHKAFEEVAIHKVKSKKMLLQLSCHPSLSISILGIVSTLQGWERMGWVPDVLIIDYADNLAPVDGKEESRHQITRTWQEMRSLSQSVHCLVVTATQTSAKAYTAYIIGREHFSESKMKNAIVTAMIGINQSDDEKVQDIIRLNYVQLREREFSRNKCVHIAGCRPIANVAVKSCY